ncbi:MAG: dipeptidase [Pseudomonadota bacterium]
MKVFFAGAAMTVLFAGLAGAPALAQKPMNGATAAKQFIIVDGHIDAPSTVANDGADLGGDRNIIEFSYDLAKAGGLDAPFMSIYVSPDYEATGGAKARADMMIGLMEGVVLQYPDKFTLAYDVKDVREAFKDGKIALPMGMENGSPIEGDLKNLKHFYDRGIRYITLAHSKANHISDSSYDEKRRWDGLSPFGFELVRAMNDIGVIVDVSHLTDDAIEDVLATTRAPVMATHSSLRHFTPDWERNLPDDLVRKIGENGGVIMINYGSAFLTREANTYRQPINALIEAREDALGRPLSEDERDALTDDYMAKNPYPFAGLDDVLDHIDRAVELAGIDHVGLGSDYDGVGDTLPTGLKTAASYPTLAQGLLDRGYDSEAVKKILGENALRVWEDVEDARRKRDW